jgi:hypothetical protein
MDNCKSEDHHPADDHEKDHEEHENQQSD